ncbi:hypothetical protein VT03_05915 [Planctomyces sp. SH-PL14]|nr:hypothetical protein VT03_05915 [Planctomyces sp. SH-PL14]
MCQLHDARRLHCTGFQDRVTAALSTCQCNDLRKDAEGIGAQIGAQACQCMAAGDGDLQQLIEAWPTLDHKTKVKIMRLLRKK